MTDLTVTGDPSWPLIQTWLAESGLDSRILPATSAERDAALIELQVTVRSALGGLVWHCGAILIDHGWVKLLGAGAGGLPPAHVAEFADGAKRFTGALCAYDALGGCFVMHGNGHEADPGEILYWAPDSLSWERLGFGHAALVHFLLSERLEVFYQGVRWRGWSELSQSLRPDEGIAAYPPPFAKEGQVGETVSRVVAPLAEVVDAGFYFAERLREHPDGDKFRVNIISRNRTLDR